MSRFMTTIMRKSKQKKQNFMVSKGTKKCLSAQHPLKKLKKKKNEKKS